MPADTPYVGIDLGTTNSVVATIIKNVAKVIERGSGQRLLPSMVGITADGERVVGEDARTLAETMPENVAYGTKRFMGQRWTPELAAHARTRYPFSLVAGPNEDVRVKLGERAVPVVQIAGMVLSQLRSDAEAYFGREVRKAVITVPAAFTDAQRQATREAAQIAGLDILRLVNEPTAAAMAFGLSTGFGGNVVVFDLGGGTFDVSILSVRRGVFEVLATGGDLFFGGEDFDNVLVEWLTSHLTDSATRERISHDRSAIRKLKTIAEQAKKTISTTERAHISAELIPDTATMHGVSIETMLTRDFFEKLVRPKTEHCLAIVERTLKEANLQENQIDAVLLVGGMTRVPLLRKLVLGRFGKAPDKEVNPDEAVALGAAMLADELRERRGSTLLLDVVGSTLGVGIAGGLVKPLIPKNKTLPCTAQETFYAGHNLQKVVRIPVVQGESRLAAENVLLGELLLDGIQVGLRSDSPIEVTFAMNQEGLLSVKAVDGRTGVSKSVEIASRMVLAPTETERLIKQEEVHRKESDVVDSETRTANKMARRELRVLITELQRVHKELLATDTETPSADAKDTIEDLGHRLVEATKVEDSGTLEQVVELTKTLSVLLTELTVGDLEPKTDPGLVPAASPGLVVLPVEPPKAAPPEPASAPAVEQTMESHPSIQTPTPTPAPTREATSEPAQDAAQAAPESTDVDLSSDSDDRF